MLQALWCGGGLPPQALALSHLDSALASGTLRYATDMFQIVICSLPELRHARARYRRVVPGCKGGAAAATHVCDIAFLLSREAVVFLRLHSVPDCGDGAETVLAGATPGAAAAAALHWLLLGAAFRGEAAPQGAQRAGSSDIGDGRVRGGEAAGAGLAAAAAGSIGSLIRMPSGATAAKSDPHLHLQTANGPASFCCHIVLKLLLLRGSECSAKRL